MSFEEIQDGHHGGYLGYGNGTNLAILNLDVYQMPPTKLQLNLTYAQERMWFEDFQDCHHGSQLAYWNRMILAILNFHVPSMPPI